jgi:hypothetical protein
MRIFFAILFISLSVFIPFKFYYILFTLVIDLNAGWVFGTFFIRALVIICLTIGVYSLFSLLKRTQKIKFFYTFLICLLPGFGISFLHPIYNTDYGIFSDEISLDHESFKTETGELLAEEKSAHLIAFFTPDCGHCQTAAYLIGVNHLAGQEINTYAIFNSDYENITRFLTDNEGDRFIAHNIGDIETFISYSEFEFPSIYLINANGETKYHWSGDMFNYSALDHILNLEVNE